MNLFHVLGVLDPNLVGIGTLATALVVAIGYMLHDRRDTDRRVDTANKALLDNLREQLERERKDCRAEREQLEQSKRQYRALLDQARDHNDALREERDDLRERLRILQLRLSQVEGEESHE